jgi:hypothetical protein
VVFQFRYHHLVDVPPHLLQVQLEELLVGHSLAFLAVVVYRLPFHHLCHHLLEVLLAGRHPFHLVMDQLALLESVDYRPLLIFTPFQIS